jgi:hypothetical protein
LRVPATPRPLQLPRRFAVAPRQTRADDEVYPATCQVQIWPTGGVLNGFYRGKKR